MPIYRDPINNLEFQILPVEMIEYRYVYWPEGEWQNLGQIARDSAYWPAEAIRVWLIDGRCPNGARDGSRHLVQVRIRIDEP